MIQSRLGWLCLILASLHCAANGYGKLFKFHDCFFLGTEQVPAIILTIIIIIMTRFPSSSPASPWSSRSLCWSPAWTGGWPASGRAGSTSQFAAEKPNRNTSNKEKICTPKMGFRTQRSAFSRWDSEFSLYLFKLYVSTLFCFGILRRNPESPIF